jgi:hypothetical protein
MELLRQMAIEASIPILLLHNDNDLEDLFEVIDFYSVEDQFCGLLSYDMYSDWWLPMFQKKVRSPYS